MKDTSATSSMMNPRFCLLTMVVVAMLVLTQPSLVYSRALLGVAKCEIECIERTTFSRSTSDDSSSRTVAKDQVFQEASGPSRKGTGH